jgi:hypothetical protein
MSCRILAILLLAVCAWSVDLPGAREVRFPGFRLLSQCDPDVTTEVGSELTRARGALASWLGTHVRPLPAGLPDLPVLLFADRIAFQAHARENARNVATAHAEGFYSGDGTPGGGKLVLFRDGGRELSTARHELVHYLIDQILPARSGQPVWFNEGLAVCAEEAWIDPGQVRLSGVPMQRHRLLRQLAADGGAPLRTITALGADGWLERAGADRVEADHQYAASYGAVLFLLNRHPDRFWAFLRAMTAGQTHDRAFAAAFNDLPEGLDSAWRHWVERGAWEAARAADGSVSAAAAAEHGMSWLPEHLPPGDPAEAARWLEGAARGFTQTPGYELDAARSWLAASEALTDTAPRQAGADAETAAEIYAKRRHQAGQAEALLQASRAWGDDLGQGDWGRAAALGRIAVQLAEAVGPDQLRASAYATYGSCFIAGRASAAPDGGDPRAEAEHALLRARELHRAGKDVDREASVVLLMAQALAPSDGKPGDWARCLSLAAEATTLWQSLPDQQAARPDLARAAAIRASLNRPDRNPGGDWAAAAALFVEEADLLDVGDDRRRLRNRIDHGTCLIGLQDLRGAAEDFADAERRAVFLKDPGLAAYTAYQTGWCLQERDPVAATEAFIRAAPGYRAAGKLREEAMAISQAAQTATKAGVAAREVSRLFAQAAQLEQARGDLARFAYCRYQQAWYSEPTRQTGSDVTVAADLYAESAAAWNASDPARAVQAQQQRARLLTPASGAKDGWTGAATAWSETAAALAALPDAAKRQAERGFALHQQAWCLIRGDGSKMTRQARQLFSEAVRLQKAGGDAAGAKVSASWIKD